MKKFDCQTCTTDNCFIKLCSNNRLNSLSEVKQSFFYKKGQTVVYEGNRVMGLFFIKEGKAKVFSTGINGKTQVVRLTKSGDIIGHRGYGGDIYPIGASVLEDSVVCFIDNDTIYEAFMHNPKLSFELMMYYSKELRNSESKVKNLSQMNVEEKVVEALLYASRIYTTNNLGLISIKLARKDLADLAGINTEQLSRVLSELKNESIISVSRNQITITQEELLRKIISPLAKA